MALRPEIIQCLGDNAVIAEDTVREQMYILGIDGEDKQASWTHIRQ